MNQDEKMKNKTSIITKRLVPLLFSITLLTAVLAINCGKERVPEKKQIILISIDTLRGDHLNSYGYFRETAPHLFKLIKDSVYYREAYPNGCWTMPSHMSLLTGTLPSRHGINKDWQSSRGKMYPRLNESLKSLPVILKTKNIATLKFAKLPGRLGFGRGFDIDDRDDPFSTNRKFFKLLQEIENNKEKDFFFFIHTWMVHAPYANCYFIDKDRLNPEIRYYINNFRVLGKEKKFATRAFHRYLIENKLLNVKNCVTLYDSGIRYVDRYVGRIIQKTKQLGIYKNLMFIVVSDHGEHFAEHYPGRFYDHHGRDYYEEFIKVPLIIKYPEQRRTGVKKSPVSLIDVLPTVLDFYDMDIPAFVQGDSLLKSLGKKDRKYIVSEAISESEFERKMIRVGDLKYIVTMGKPFKTGRVNWETITERRLFDLKNDPLEKNNLFTDLKFRQVCINFEKMLRNIIDHSVSADFAVEEAEISEETIDQLKALGYL